MRILWHIEPLYQVSSPTFKKGWADHFIALQVESLRVAGGFDFAVITNAALAPYVPSGIEVMVFSQAELLEIFGYAKTADDILNDFFQEDMRPGTLPPARLKAYAEVIRHRAGPWRPDMVISGTPMPWVRLACPEAVPLYFEYGFTSRPPFPESWYYDVEGTAAGYGLHAMRKAAQMPPGTQLAPECRRRLVAYKERVHSLIAEHNPFKVVIEEAHGRFRKLALLTLSGSLPFLYQVFQEQEDRFHTILEILGRLPADWGLVVVKHPNDADLIAPAAMEQLKIEYPNLIYDASFEHWLSASQYWYADVDVIISGFSACALQSLIWDKPLLTISHGHADAVAMGHIDDLPRMPACGPRSRDAYLYWLLTRYFVPDFLLQSPEWLSGYLRGLHGRMQDNTRASDPYAAHDPDEETFFLRLCEALNSNLPVFNNIPSQASLRQKNRELAKQQIVSASKSEEVKLKYKETELQCSRLEQENTRLHEELNSIYCSRRWRFTVPMVKIANTWRKIWVKLENLRSSAAEKKISERTAGGTDCTIYCSNICGRRGLDVKRLETYLRANRFTVHCDDEPGDILLFLGCAFNNSCEQTSLEQLKRLSRFYKKVFVLEGISMTVPEDRLRELAGRPVTVVPMYCWDMLDQYFCRGTRFHDTAFEHHSHVHGQDDIWDVQVSHGCADHCTFCGDKRVVGDLRSRPLPDVLEDCRRGLLGGFTQIRLLGDDVGAAGLDRNYSLIDLLDQCTLLPGITCLRLEEINVKYLIRHLDALDPILDRGILQYLALAFQHADDDILRRMNRGYNGKQLERLAVLLRRFGVVMRFHAIMAFPGETDAQLETLLGFITKQVFPSGSIFIFEPCAGTPAAALTGRFTAEDIRRKIDTVSARLEKAGYAVTPHLQTAAGLPDKLWVTRNEH
jgi:tRNA A37 methylthiotransferase MiaB